MTAKAKGFSKMVVYHIPSIADFRAFIGQRTKRRDQNVKALGGALALVVLTCGSARAAPAVTPPAIRIAVAPHVSVTSGQAYYSGLASPLRTWSTDVHPLIQSAARRLQNDPDRIYDFVHNAIETEPMFGLSKGAVGALVNRSGTAFDQAELMVKLLKAAGIPARYRYGNIVLTGAQFAAWQGTSNAAAAQEILDDGGIPNDPTGTGTLTQVTLVSLWVEAQIGGTWVQFNPALKSSTWYAPTTLQSLMGYNRTSVRTAAGSLGSGATINGGAAGALSTELTREAGLLLTALNGSSYQPLSTEQVYGGSRITQVLQTSLRQTNLPEASGASTVWDGDIPNSYRVKIAVSGYDTTTNPNTPSVSSTVYGDDYYGARYRVYTTNPAISWSFLGINVPPWGSQTRLPNPAVQFGTYDEKTSFNLVSVDIQHPYAGSSGTYGHQVYTTPTWTERIETIPNICNSGCTSSNNWPITIALRGITVTLGKESDRAQELLARQYARTDLCPPYNYAYNTSPDTYYCGFATAPDGQAARLSNAARLAEGISSSRISPHNTVSFNFFTLTEHQWSASDWSPPYTQYWRGEPGSVSLASVQSEISVIANSGVATDRLAAIGAHASLFAAAEAQPMLASVNRNTPADMIANAAPAGSFRWITSANVATVITQLTNYDTVSTADIQSYVAAGYNVLAPLQGNIGASLTPYIKGAAFWAFKVDGGSAPVFVPLGSSIILKGAAGSGPVADPSPKAITKSYMDQFNKSVFDPSKALSADFQSGLTSFSPPTLLSTGAGDFPQKLDLKIKLSGEPTKGVIESLTASPSVQTSQRTAGSLGHVFYTSLEHDLALGDDFTLSLGSRSPLDAVQAVTAAVVTMEEYRSSTDGLSGLVVMGANAWLGHQLEDGVATIVHGVDGIEKFVRGPSGAWNPLPDTGAKLVQTGSAQYVAPYNRRGYLGVRFTYTSANGQTKTFRQPSPGTATGAAALNSTEISNCAATGSPSSGGTALTSAQLNEWEKEYWGIERTFGLDKWSFPTGEAVQAQYVAGSSQRCYLVHLDRLTNNYGRFITTSWSTNAWVDDNGRQVTASAANDTGFVVISANSAPSPFAYQRAFTLPSGRQLWLLASGCQAGYKDPYVKPRTYCGELDLYFNDNTHPLQRLMLDLNDEGVASIADGTGNSTGYAILPGHRATIISPLSEVSSTAYDTRGQAIDSRDPLGRVTSTAFDGRGRRILETRPEGDSTGYTYDARSNILSVVRHAIPATSLPDTQVTRAYYEAGTVSVCVNPITCNAPANDTEATNADGRVRTTNYSWNGTTGQLSQILKPVDAAGVRPQTDFAYTGFTGTDGASISLLTLKTVKVSGTASEKTAFDYDTTNHLSLKTSTADPGGLGLRTCFKFDTVGNLPSTTDARATTCP